MKLRERLTDMVEQVWDGCSSFIESLVARARPVSFCVISASDSMWFVDAHKFEVDRKGRLRFECWGREVAVANAGEWKRVVRGLSFEDVHEKPEAV